MFIETRAFRSLPSATAVALTVAVVAGAAATTGCGEPTTDGRTHHTERTPRSCAAAALAITRFPFDGINGRDWMINNYVDLDGASPGVADYRGRPGDRARTYDGHQGIDIDIPSFREMDRGTAVIHAVTAGTVDQVIDDQPDRNTSCTGRWNVISVRHPNGFVIRYGHIKRGSARVARGQVIGAGTPLAIAGSAGCSTQPHLHLEVRDCADHAVETLLRPGAWTAPPAYDPPSGIMDVMLMEGDVPSVAQIKDPPPNPSVIAPDGTLGVGLSAAVRGGDVITTTLIDPTGRASAQRLIIAGAARFAHGYPRFALAIGATSGVWTIEVGLNGARAATRTVRVAPPPPALGVDARADVRASKGRTSPPHRTTRARRRSGWPPPPRGSRSQPGAPAPPAQPAQRRQDSRTALRPNRQ
jgi:murein DD-endopeptidase MepM/ murein hydrolase activator NlpD